jgi:glycosyltransferase involved in cell wall biosynthesis
VNQRDLPGAYAAADCLVLPSDHGETWGLVVNEAMACGLPAIVSDQVGCSLDLVQPGETGAVFPFGDWEALAKLLADNANEENLQRQGDNARARVADYSIENLAQGTFAAVRYAVQSH